MMSASDAIQGWHRSGSFAGKSAHAPQPDNAVSTLVDDFFPAALAMLLRAFPHLA